MAEPTGQISFPWLAAGARPDAPTGPEPATAARTSPEDGGAGGGAVVRGDLADQARRKYLSYALSVITSRAIPDVRDGLKPVQRRILYTMWHDLRLTHEAKHRKSAKVVGDVIGKYHPHGDTAVYDAMVRMAQDFVMRAPLVDGQGNFGSLDGDAPAAYRYTEARLAPIARELLVELGQDTVDHRPTYDGGGIEPVVLPARFPNILVNGGTGIAVGMAAAIPPHNLGEVVRACIHLIDTPAATTKQLLRFLRGPDFPTGGRIVATRSELASIYETGRGSIKLRGDWKVEERKSGPVLVITSIPYGVEKSALVESIGQLVVARKLAMVGGVQDLSTHDVRIELTPAGRGNFEPEVVMAYLYKHTRLQTSVKVDLTCLVPTSNPEVAAPARLDLRGLLRHFLDFRVATVRRRFEYTLRRLRERIHVLEGFEIVFGDLDRAIRIIRRSEGKADAAKKLMKAFELSEVQADAILETKLYRLAKLEIEKIRRELAEKRKEARWIEGILRSEKKLWLVVRSELEEIAARYADRRRTRISADDFVEAIDTESFIVDEDAVVLVTETGWTKRQRTINPATTRMREGDRPLALVGGSTRSSVIYFTNYGTAYNCRIADVPPSTGHGSPVQGLFKFRDGERVVAAVGTDSRVMPEFGEEKPELGEEYEEPYPHMMAATRRGSALRFTLWPHKEPSTKRGRMFARPAKGDEVVSVFKIYADEDVCVVTRKGRCLRCNAQEIPLLSGPGKGVRIIKIDPDDEVVAAMPAQVKVTIHKSTGGTMKLRGEDREPTARGGRGRPLFSRGKVERVEPPPLAPPDLEGEG